MKAPIEWYKGKGEGGGGGVERVLCHRCKNSRLFPKYEEVQHGWHQNFEQLFPRICWDESLESVKCGKEPFFSLGQPQKYSSSQIPTGKQFVLIDRVGGLDGKYLGRGDDVRTERIDIRAP